MLMALSLYIFAQTSVTANVAEASAIEFSSAVQPIRYHISSCLDYVFSEGLTKLGHNGGFIFPPYSSLGSPKITEGAYFTYLYSKQSEMATPIDLIGNNMFPQAATGNLNWEEQLEDYILENDARRMRECFDDFIHFRNKGFIFNTGNITAKVQVLDNAVIANLHYPLTIALGDKTAFLSDFHVKYPIRLGSIRNEVENIIAAVKVCEQTYYEEVKDQLTSCNKNKVDKALVAEKCSFRYQDEDLEIYDYSYSDTNSTIKARFCKNTPIGRFCEDVDEEQPEHYISVHAVVDSKDKSTPYSFLFSTRMNWDVNYPGEITCP